MNIIGPNVKWRLSEFDLHGWHSSKAWHLAVKFYPNGDDCWWTVKEWSVKPSDKYVRDVKEIAMLAFRVFAKNIFINQDAFTVEDSGVVE